MSNQFHIYCDESCHLPNDHQTQMILGALWCPADKRKMLSGKVKALKREFGLSPQNEIKWVKVSDSKIDFYLKLVDLFFNEPELHYRAVSIDKNQLDHDAHDQTHDDFYYKMWWQCIDKVIDKSNRYRIFIDKKDTRGAERVKKLKQVLHNSNYDFDEAVIESVEQVQSHDIILLQIADLMTGAIGHFKRGLTGSKAKTKVIELIQQRSQLSFRNSSPLSNNKFNLFVWRSCK